MHPQFNYQIFLPVFFVFILAISCEYEPTGETYKEISDGYGEIDIQLLDASYPIVLSDDRLFYYEIDLNHGQTIFEVNIYMDDALLDSTDTESGYFHILIDRYEAGDHLLTIEVLTSSGSTSLANRLGGEALFYNRQWPLRIVEAGEEF